MNAHGCPLGASAAARDRSDGDRGVVVGLPAGGPSVPIAPAPALRTLVAALLDGADLDRVVPATLAVVERDPLASAGYFGGDLLRGLMGVPARFWARTPSLYARYREAVRAAALARRRLPARDRMEFWAAPDPRGPTALPNDTAPATRAGTPARYAERPGPATA